MKVVYDHNMPAVDAYLGHCCELLPVDGRQLTATQLGDADALLVRSVTPVNAALLADSALRFVGSATSGIDHVDLALLERRGIAFTHAPGANANAVVEYVLGAIAAVGDALERLFDGAQLGIVGYGHVGRSLAARCQALGIRWCAYDPWLPAASIPCCATLEDVLRCAVISLHPELTRRAPWSSYHLLGPAPLAHLGASQLLINASRGAVVDNAALLGRLSAADAPVAVLDVWEHEPLVDASLLARVRLGTAHIAGYSLDAKIAATRRLAAALIDRFELPPPPALPTGLALSPLRLEATGAAAAVRSLLRQRYVIEDDDRRLRETVLSGVDVAAGFDRLRRDYPERREVAGSRVMVPETGGVLADCVEALGAVPVTEEP